MEKLTRVTRVAPTGGRTLRVAFDGAPDSSDVDLSGIIERSRHFAPLRDRRAFASASIAENGLGIEWPVTTPWGRLDLSASTLRRIATAG